MNIIPIYRCILHDSQGCKSHELSLETIQFLVSKLAATDWTREMRFITLSYDRGPTSADTSWVPDFVGYLNLFGHPRGVFIEALIPRTAGSQDAPVPHCPMRPGERKTMSRIWVGLRYRRVPIECLLDPQLVPSIVRYYLEHPGQLYPEITWQNEEAIDWKFQLSPEDDWFDPAEPETRPASQSSVSKDEVLRRLQASYLQVGLASNFIEHTFGSSDD